MHVILSIWLLQILIMIIELWQNSPSSSNRQHGAPPQSNLEEGDPQIIEEKFGHSGLDFADLKSYSE